MLNKLLIILLILLFGGAMYLAGLMSPDSTRESIHLWLEPYAEGLKPSQAPTPPIKAKDHLAAISNVIPSAIPSAAQGSNTPSATNTVTLSVPTPVVATPEPGDG